MQKYNEAPIVSVEVSSNRYTDDFHKDLDLKAEKLLMDYQSGSETARESFRKRHPIGTREGFTPALLDARQVIMMQNMEGQHLSLEKLKNDAKRFLKDLKAEEPIAVHRARSADPKVISGARSLGGLTLVDVHHILAIENGFDSWPKLKHHLAAMDAAAVLVSSGKAQDGPASLHIRCGSDIGPVLKDAGLKGDFMEVINPFAMGPVFPQRLEPESLNLRSRYINEVLGPYIEAERRANMTKDLRDEEQALLSLPGRYEDITLWFEHDAYDQLCLAYVLHHMSKHNQPLPFTLDLVQIDRFPGVKRFIGIGQLSLQPAGISLLYQQRVPITLAMISFGATMWEAFTNKNPTDLWHLTQKENVPLPLMQRAMLRMLAELPSPVNGLGLTEQLALDIIAKEGSLLTRRAFLFFLAERDPQPYHGDIMFFAILKGLWNAERPALEIIGRVDAPGEHGKEILTLTPFGEALLKGEENWLHHNDVQNWVGGVEINSKNRKNWSFEGDGEAPYRS